MRRYSMTDVARKFSKIVEGVIRDGQPAMISRNGNDKVCIIPAHWVEQKITLLNDRTQPAPSKTATK